MKPDEATPQEGLRIAMLPPSLRFSARALATELDDNGDGVLDERELANALNQIKESRKKNRNLTRVVGGLAGSAVLLTGAVFGTSIAAAHLSKDTAVDGQGVLHAKGTGSVVKTGEALSWSSGRNLVDLSKTELMNLEHVALMGGNVHFKVKGFAKSPPSEEDRVVLLVEGGTLAYDAGGMAEATGDALALVNAAHGTDHGAQRKLQHQGVDLGFGNVAPGNPLIKPILRYDALRVYRLGKEFESLSHGYVECPEEQDYFARGVYLVQFNKAGNLEYSVTEEDAQTKAFALTGHMIGDIREYEQRIECPACPNSDCPDVVCTIECRHS